MACLSIVFESSATLDAYTSAQILTSGLFLPLRRLLRLEKCALSAGSNVVLSAESLGVGAQMIVGNEFSAGWV
jgi:hypothetical protein